MDVAHLSKHGGRKMAVYQEQREVDACFTGNQMNCEYKDISSRQTFQGDSSKGKEVT